MNINLNNILHETKGQAEAKLVLGKNIGAFSVHSKLSAAPQRICLHVGASSAVHLTH